MSKGLQIAIGTLTVFAGVVWLVTLGSSSEGTFAYYTSVGEFVTASAGAEPRSSRVHGFVLEGSIAKDLPAGHVDFAIRDEAGAALPVRLRGIELPDLFRDGAEVVVEGRLEGERFVATQVLAKCPSKYEAEQAREARAQRGEAERSGWAQGPTHQTSPSSSVAESR